MDFSAYRSFNVSFEQKYSFLLREYPFAMMMLEKQLRNLEAGFPDISKINMRKMERYNFVRRLRALGALLFSKNMSVPTYYLKLERFETLEKGLKPLLASKGLHPLDYQKHLQRLATMGNALPRFMRKARAIGLAEAIQDRNLLLALDKQTRQNYRLVLAFMRKKNIRLVIADGDTLPHMRLIAMAAREIATPSIVFSHGYIQDLQLVSIAPIYSDYHITWTEQQAVDLAASISSEDAEKVRFFGYPKATYPLDGRDDFVLIAWHPLIDSDRAKEIETILALAKRLMESGYSVRLRLHPKDGADGNLREIFGREGVDVSNYTLAEDINAAGIVVGSFSSVLIEAVMSGKKVYQLEEYRTFAFEGVTHFSLSSDISQILKQPKNISAPVPFNYSLFGGFLDSIVNFH